jgi:N-acetyl-anhydromuramyl-L-alanine amidase AmpD
MAKAAAALRKLFTVDRDLELEASEPEHDWRTMPHSSKRAYGPLDTIVIHCTAGSSVEGAYSTMLSKGVSSHIIIPDYDKATEPRKTVRLVPDERKAFHVLKTLKFQGKQDTNSRSLGIEIVNTGLESDPYSLKQVAETAAWTRYWMSKHPIKYIVTHAYLDPERRSDPCVTFPWDAFIKEVMRNVDDTVTQPTIVFSFMGRILEADGEIQDGTAWGQVRPIVEALGFRVSYDSKLKTVYISK